MKSIYSKLGANRFFIAAFSTVTAIALALVLILSLIPVGVTHIDLTTHKRYSLSAESVALAQSVQDEVTLYLIASAGSESTDTLALLDRYSRSSSKIKTKTLYAENDKALMSKYLTYNEYSDGGIIVESSRRSLYIPAHLLVSYSDSARENAMQIYNYYYQSGETTLKFSEFLAYYGEHLGLNDGDARESRINMALKYVTADNIKTFYFTAGTANEYFSDSILLKFAQNMIELKSISLDSENIPSGTDGIILMPVESDISDTARRKLSDYLNNGGSITLMSSYGVSGYKNLASLCSDFGLFSSESYVFEDTASHYYSSPETVLPNIRDLTVADELSDNQIVMLPFCTEIKLADTLPSGISVQPLMVSSARSYVKSSLTNGYAFDEETDERGERNLAVKATNTSGGQLVYIASAFVLVDDFDYYSNDGNKTAFFAIMRLLTGNEQLKEYPEPTSAAPVYLQISEPYLYAFIGIGAALTVAVLATGIILGFKRNK